MDLLSLCLFVSFVFIRLTVCLSAFVLIYVFLYLCVCLSACVYVCSLIMSVFFLVCLFVRQFKTMYVFN